MAAMQEIADWLAMTSISDDRKSEGAGTMIVVHHLNNSRSPSGGPWARDANRRSS